MEVARAGTQFPCLPLENIFERNLDVGHRPDQHDAGRD